jgi:hypothetical protein
MAITRNLLRCRCRDPSKHYPCRASQQALLQLLQFVVNSTAVPDRCRRTNPASPVDIAERSDLAAQHISHLQSFALHEVDILLSSLSAGPTSQSIILSRTPPHSQSNLFSTSDHLFLTRCQTRRKFPLPLPEVTMQCLCRQDR